MPHEEAAEQDARANAMAASFLFSEAGSSRGSSLTLGKAMRRPLRAYVPHALLLLAALSGAWVFGGILTFLAGYQGAIEYKIQTGAWGWVEGMMLSMDAGRVFVAAVVQTAVLLVAIRDSRKNAAVYPKWFFVPLTAFCAPLGVGYYVSLVAFGILPN